METTKRSTFKVLFYLKKNAPKKNGRVPVMCRLTVNGQASAFSSKLDITPESWDLKYGRMLGKSKEAKEINLCLDEMRSAIGECYRTLQRSEGTVTVDKLKKMYLGADTGEMTFLVFFSQFIADFERKVHSGLRTIGTLRRYQTVLRQMRSFLQYTYKADDISFRDLNCSLIQEFDFYLRDRQGLQHNSVWLYMIALTTVCHLAMSRKYLAFDPFSEYKNTKKDTDRGYLIKSELQQLINQPLENKRDKLIRDLFVFSCFTGLAYSDVKALKETHIQEFFDGKQWIILRRRKTATSSNVLLLEAARMIIDKYRGMAKDGKIFNVPSNDCCNSRLKQIAKDIPCLEGKKVTFHLARHTFATLFLSEGIPLESLSKMMGHKNIATTQIYAKVLNEKVGKDMELVANKLNGLVGKQA